MFRFQILIKEYFTKSQINISLIVTVFFLNYFALAQNPLILDQYTADPTARVFNGKIYVYPSHDIKCTEDKGKPGWFCMEDYHVFSSENLTEWKDHGEILNQKDISWADSEAYSMWAPDCIEKDGKYYFYFPTKPEKEEGFTVGVAISNNPDGPFIPQQNPIAGVNGIDPNVFIDTDGEAYLYWSGRKIYVAKLNANMTALASTPQVIANLPEEGHLEGPFMFKQNGKYYLTYPHVANKTERLEYAMGDSPEGPFTVTGVIMDESPTGCWTNHHSILKYKEQWYLFYHHNDLSPEFDKNRSIRADSLAFNADGTIKKVIPTLRGVGVNSASDTLQIDRFSSKSSAGVLNFNNPKKTFEGWNISLKTNDWVQYNTVKFEKKYTRIRLKFTSEEGAFLEVKTTSGKLITVMEIPKKKEWSVKDFDIDFKENGTYNIKLIVRSGKLTVDWLQFK